MDNETSEVLKGLGLPAHDYGELPTSKKRFADGSRWKVEIPSVEGPEAFRNVLKAADHHGVTLHRVSQGSGIMMQTDDEIREMVDLGKQHAIEVCLFTGPRGSWDVGAQARASSGGASGATLRGANQLGFGIEDVLHGAELGLRSVLVADLGHLWVLNEMREAGVLPSDFIFKTSISLPTANPATAKVLESLGADTINLPGDLSLSQYATIREAVDVPLDIYVEGADDFGGLVRYYEIPELVRVAAPVHLKFTVRNSPGIYPAGEQLEAIVLASARERVRRAAIGISLLKRYDVHR